MEKERWNKVVVKNKENMNEKDMMSKKGKPKKKERTNREEGEKKCRKVDEEKKKKVEEENQNEYEENKKEEERKQEKEKDEKKEKGEHQRKRERKHRTKEKAEAVERKEGVIAIPEFFKIIFPEKHIEKLRIPQAFNKFLENESLGVVSLKGPSGNTWHATLVLDSGGFYFTHGWNEFFIDHNINLGDFLVFRYDGQSQFSVRIFDTTACEKSSAFLARPFKDVNKEGGLQEDVDYVSICATNTSESKNQGGATGVCDTLQHGEGEDMDIEPNDMSETLLLVNEQWIEKTRKIDDIHKDCDRAISQKSNIVLLDKSMKGNVPPKGKGSLRMNCANVTLRDP